MTVQPNLNRPSWDEYFMLMAMLASLRSPDPSTRVGAVIVSPDRKVMGTGYNSFPRGCEIHLLPWEREGELHETKYAYVQHAEKNAILNKVEGSLKDCSIYTTLYPCHDCTGMIIQSGIKHIYYTDGKYIDTPSAQATKRMLDLIDTTPREVVISKETLELCRQIF